MAGPYSMSMLKHVDEVCLTQDTSHMLFFISRVYGNLYNTPEELFMPGFESLFERMMKLFYGTNK